LVTDYDYSAMAIFAVSQYGGRTSQQGSKHFSTNGNTTGVYAGSYNMSIYTSTVVPDFNDSTTERFKGLFDENGNLKKYINRIDPTTGKEYDANNNETGKIAISYLSASDGGTAGWFNAYSYVGTSVNYPIGVRNGLFNLGCR